MVYSRSLVGKMLKAKREKKKLSHNALHFVLGISIERIVSIESGETIMELWEGKEIALFLQEPFEKVMSVVGEERFQEEVTVHFLENVS